MIQCPFCAPDQARIISRCQMRDCNPRWVSNLGRSLAHHSQITCAKAFLTLEPEEQRIVWTFVAQVRQQLAIELKVRAFNIGINDGKEAGQTD